MENVSVPYIRMSLLLTNLLSAYNIRGKRVVVLGGAHHKMSYLPPPPQLWSNYQFFAEKRFLLQIT